MICYLLGIDLAQCECVYQRGDNINSFLLVLRIVLLAMISCKSNQHKSNPYAKKINAEE